MIYLALINRLHKVEKIDEQLAADVAAVFFDQKDYPTVYGLCKLLTNDTQSIGGAIGLLKLKLPDWDWQITHSGHGSYDIENGCELLNPLSSSSFHGTQLSHLNVVATGKTPTIAILVALLTAVELHNTKGKSNENI